MRPFNGYEQAKEAVKFEGLPRGGYELIIKGATPYKWVGKQLVDWSREDSAPDMLHIFVDVNAGEYKGYFENNYKAQQSEDKQWRGVLKLYFPKDDGTKEDGWTKNSFARAMNAIEDSNDGFRWTWDEKALKGKVVGGLFNLREYTKGDGTVGKALNLHSFIDIKKIQSGDFKVPEDKLIEKSKYVAPEQYSAPGRNAGFMDIPEGVQDEGLPFN